MLLGPTGSVCRLALVETKKKSTLHTNRRPSHTRIKCAVKERLCGSAQQTRGSQGFAAVFSVEDVGVVMIIYQILFAMHEHLHRRSATELAMVGP